MRKALLCTLVCFALARAAHADEWVVEAHFEDQAALQRAASHFQHVIVDRSRNLVRLETNDAGIRTLEAEGLTVTIDVVATSRIRAIAERIDAAAAEGRSIDSIPGFECYRTVEETQSTLADLAADPRDIARIDDLGPTWEKSQDASQGYEMQAIHITNFATLASDPDRPHFAAYFSIHAREYAPGEIGTRFAEWLVHGYGVDPEATWLVDHNEFHLVTPANPDGRKQAEQQIYWRKNVDQIAGNCDGNQNVETDGDGIDLNRNFPFHWNVGNGGSSGFVCDETYRGPLAGSEPETQNLFRYVAGTCDSDGTCTGGIFPDLRAGPMSPPDGGDAAPADTRGFFLDMHSNAALVLWPWGDTANDSPNVTGLTTLGRRIAWFNGYTPEQSNELYLTDGTTDDSMYGLLGVASYTIETGGSDFFEDCSSFEGFTAPANLAALRYISRSLHAPYELPAGPDTLGVSANPDLVVAGDAVTVRANLDSGRFNQSNGSQTVHDVASALAYIDALPWDGAEGTALEADDGSFDAPAEAATAAIATDGLAPGRHFVYVQGTDDAANAGTPNAAYFDVADASEIGTVEGTVVAASDQSPLAATITLTSETGTETHHAGTDPATGQYTVHAFPGSFDLRVSALHYMPQTIDGQAIEAGVVDTANFQLLPDCVIFADDVESGGDAWTAQTPWRIVEGVDGNATNVWDTPNYGDQINRSLTTAAAYDLTGYNDITLDFDDRCDTEAGFDFGFAEYSANNGSTWSPLYSCTGQTSWQSHHVELPADANGASALKLRFRITSDSFQNAPGWAIDNVRLAGGGDACLGQQIVDRLFANGFDPD